MTDALNDLVGGAGLLAGSRTSAVASLGYCVESLCLFSGWGVPLGEPVSMALTAQISRTTKV